LITGEKFPALKGKQKVGRGGVMHEIPKVEFAIDESPYCVWGIDLREQNLEYISSLNPRYFEYVVNANIELLKGEERQFAAIAIRSAYSQALETLFALIGATIQAPDCIVGWMIRYRNPELTSLVKKIHEGRSIYTKITIEISWEKLAERVHSLFKTDGAEKDIRIRDLFAALWSRLASDFLDARSNSEYNSIKHGLRVRPGGFHLSLGPEEIPGVLCPPEQMKTIASSEFGSSYFVHEQLHNNRNISIRRQSVNWSPEAYAHRTLLITCSIANILGYIKALNRVDIEDHRFMIPTDESIFDKAWEQPGGAFDISFKFDIDPNSIRPRSQEEILSVYSQNEEKSGDHKT
jgi:hypothetical protein